jgi:hypothetical protein
LHGFVKIPPDSPTESHPPFFKVKELERERGLDNSTDVLYCQESMIDIIRSYRKSIKQCSKCTDFVRLLYKIVKCSKIKEYRGTDMKEKPLLSLLDRDKVIVETKEIYGKQLDLLEDLVNYGTYLVARVYDSSKKNLEDGIVIGVLLKHIIMMVDAIHVLASKGVMLPANLQVRSIFEASLYMDWIIQDDSNNKAKYYYVANIRNRKTWALKIQNNTAENTLFINQLGEYSHIISPQSIPEEIKTIAGEQILNIDKTLNSEKYKAINETFEQKKKKTTGVDPHWYELLGVKSIAYLAKELNRLPEYIFCYSLGSNIAHISSYLDQVKFGKGTVTLKPIRHLEAASNVLQTAITLSIRSYRVIIMRYRQAELQNFKKKYIDDWRKPSLNIPSVNEKSIH